MSANVNDDLIEATIRRVNQAKAAAARAGDDEAARRAAKPETPGSQSEAIDYLQPAESAEESAIEATIRRVAEAKAKADAEETDTPPDHDVSIGSAIPHVDESAIEATIRRVAEAKAQAEASDDNTDDTVDESIAASVNVDESAIEATIHGMDRDQKLFRGITGHGMCCPERSTWDFTMVTRYRCA